MHEPVTTRVPSDRGGVASILELEGLVRRVPVPPYSAVLGEGPPVRGGPGRFPGAKVCRVHPTLPEGRVSHTMQHFHRLRGLYLL